MFCRNCGAKMTDNDKFCPKCGTARLAEQSQVRKMVEDNSVKLQLKPKFNILYKVISNIGQFLFGTFIIFFSVAYVYNLWSIMIAIMAIYIIVKMLFEKIQYDNMEYNFYATKIEYKDGFLNKEEKELKYKYIREITMSQNILERICGIGTIRIFTNASNYEYSRNYNNRMSRNGIYIHCVDNVQEQYKNIKQIIDEGTPEEY